MASELKKETAEVFCFSGSLKKRGRDFLVCEGGEGRIEGKISLVGVSIFE
jgi:hypothetical protein